jgi:beta-galactosidase
MKYGVSYYPEQKTESELEHDLALMKESGINIVRMGEFAWCRFEPVEGEYDFTWLDNAIERLGAVGLNTIVCTPTACPPAWLVEKYPEILYKDNRGVVRPFGGRRHYCYNSPIYREYSRKIAEQIGQHYGNNKFVMAFQIDNELAQEGTGRCHCDCCKEKFQHWLKEKYGTIKNLNEKMGTIFWGQEYNSFEQINMPINTIEVGAQDEIIAYYDNPSIRLEYERFCSISNTEYQNIQRDALKKYTDKIVTTNATGLATNSINYYESFKNLDNYAYDFYPSLRDIEINSFSYSFGRGVKDKNFWLLEFVSGGGHRLGGSGRLQPYPGALKQSVIHAFSAGAELLAHFQFRTFPFGAEQLNYAIVDSDGIPRRSFYEMKAAAKDLKALEQFLKESKIENSAAICFDYDVLWATKIKPPNKETLNYLDYCNEIYDLLIGIGVGTDVISYNYDLSKYKLVIIPTPFVMSEEVKKKLKNYVRNGGTLISTFLAAAKNIYNVGISESLPCGLTDLFGIRVGEVEPVFERSVTRVSLSVGSTKYEGSNKYWTEVLEPIGAKIIGRYEEDFRRGEGVISENSYGEGKAYYIGTGLEKEVFTPLIEEVLEEAKVRKIPFKFESGIEVIERRYNGKPAYCIFNFLKRDTEIELDKPYISLLTGESLEGKIKIQPKGYVVLIKPIIHINNLRSLV